MNISERILELIEEKGMTQKEFAEKTGIAQSTISDWKRKKTNPIAEKIMIIAETLGVTPEELLSGAEISGTRSRKEKTFVIDKDTEIGEVIETYQSLDKNARERLLGYMHALKERNTGDGSLCSSYSVKNEKRNK